MNEKYLWDKTGEDAEIERLENSLKTFRHRENAAPELPAKIIPFEAKTPRRFFRFAFASAICAILLAAGLSVWSGVFNAIPTSEIAAIENNPTLPDNSINFTESPESNELNAPTVAEKNLPAIEKLIVPKSAVEAKPIKVRKTFHAANSNGEIIASNQPPKNKSVKLTREEKYAYDQLMLALSITSSNLKVVRDKSEGLDKEDNAFSDKK